MDNINNLFYILNDFKFVRLESVSFPDSDDEEFVLHAVLRHNIQTINDKHIFLFSQKILLVFH